MDWKENAHLFANGKFKCLYNHIGKDWIAEIRGIDMNGFIIKLESLNTPRTSHFEYCTLIARPISDLSDEETELFGRYGYADDWQPEVWEDIRNLMSKHASQDIFSPSELLQFISLGVYPFDQSHFESGDVIDITTLKEMV